MDSNISHLRNSSSLLERAAYYAVQASWLDADGHEQAQKDATALLAHTTCPACAEKDRRIRELEADLAEIREAMQPLRDLWILALARLDDNAVLARFKKTFTGKPMALTLEHIRRPLHVLAMQEEAWPASDDEMDDPTALAIARALTGARAALGGE